MLGVIFIDLKRAFEVVDRKILLKKLEGHGIKGLVLRWFENYTEGRAQRMKFNGNISESIKVELSGL